MKNLKKVLALVVALTMVLGTVGFAFTDVPAESEAYTAVQTLSSLSILNGYTDGTFGPEKDITRAEFAAVVCRALGMEGSAKGAAGATQFADVPADHWATGYINLAAGQGIVNGYGDGNFGPNDNVTYEQAVKMLVVALGFEPMAAQKGGYPTGYLVVANTYGMTKGVYQNGESAAANRGTVAQLTYNALDIPMMEQTGFGTNVEYKIQDGTNNTNYKTLLTGLEVAKLEGAVTATPVIGGTVVDEIEFRIDEANDNAYWEKWLSDNSWNQNFTRKTNLKVAEGVNAADYFGYASVLYAKEVRSGKWEVIAVMPGDDSVTVEIEKNDISGLVANDELRYYETETAKKETVLKLNNTTGVEVYYNNVVSSITDLNGIAWDADTEITLIENTGDSRFDMIVAKDYNYGVIDTVEADKDRYSLKNVTGKFSFDFEDEDVSYTIVNKDGEAITLADFNEGDVIAYIIAKGPQGNDIKKDFAWCEIINLGDNSVSGTVTEINTLDNAIYVDGTDYEKAAIFNKTVNVNDEGTYYLTKTGKIFDVVVDASVASNYAYILEAGLNQSAFNNAWQFKLLTKDGEVAIYDVKDTFTVNGQSYAKDAASIAGVATSGSFKVSPEMRLVTYKLDGNGKIRQMNTVTNALNIATVGAPGNGAEYNANAYAIDGKVIEDDAVIFNVAGNDMDDAFVTSIENLIHESEYYGFLFKNADNEFDAFVILEGKGAIDYTQDIAVVDSINKITLDDDDAYKVRYYTANEDELKEITVTADTTFDASSQAYFFKNDGSLKAGKGTVIMFAAGEDGIVTDIAVIANAQAKGYNGIPYDFNANVVAKIEADTDYKIVTSYIDTIATTKKGINLTHGAGMFTVTNDVNAYTYNNDLNKPAIEVGDWMGADVDAKGEVVVGKAHYFIAILENGLATDIITYSAEY